MLSICSHLRYIWNFLNWCRCPTRSGDGGEKYDRKNGPQHRVGNKWCLIIDESFSIMEISDRSYFLLCSVLEKALDRWLVFNNVHVGWKYDCLHIISQECIELAIGFLFVPRSHNVFLAVSRFLVSICWFWWSSSMTFPCNACLSKILASLGHFQLILGLFRWRKLFVYLTWNSSFWESVSNLFRIDFRRQIEQQMSGRL